MHRDPFLNVNGIVFSSLPTASPAACRCLARIASAIALAAQGPIKSGKMGRSSDGLLELLLKGAAHSSIHVCGICLEAIPSLIAPGSSYSDRLLPILQQRAIVPAALRGNHTTTSADEADIDFHEYTSFRENLLSSALSACYKNNRGFYVESCASAIEEFCTAPLTPQLPFQLEAALFCLCAVSMDASKRALLVSASPAAQAAAAKASAALGQAQTSDIAVDAKKHDDELAKCTLSIANNPAAATSNPLTLAQLCRFIAKVRLVDENIVSLLDKIFAGISPMPLPLLYYYISTLDGTPRHLPPVLWTRPQSWP